MNTASCSKRVEKKATAGEKKRHDTLTAVPLMNFFCTAVAILRLLLLPPLRGRRSCRGCYWRWNSRRGVGGGVVARGWCEMLRDGWRCCRCESLEESGFRRRARCSSSWRNRRKNEKHAFQSAAASAKARDEAKKCMYATCQAVETGLLNFSVQHHHSASEFSFHTHGRNPKPLQQWRFRR